MSWRDITSTWLTNNSGKEDRLILDLIRYLVERNIIPETLVDNLTLHSILLPQIMLETLNGISVPKTPQGEYLYLPRERQRNDDVGTRGKKRQAHQIVRRTNRSELGPLS